MADQSSTNLAILPTNVGNDIKTTRLLSASKGDRSFHSLLPITDKDVNDKNPIPYTINKNSLLSNPLEISAYVGAGGMEEEKTFITLENISEIEAPILAEKTLDLNLASLQMLSVKDTPLFNETLPSANIEQNDPADKSNKLTIDNLSRDQVVFNNPSYQLPKPLDQLLLNEDSYPNGELIVEKLPAECLSTVDEDSIERLDKLEKDESMDFISFDSSNTFFNALIKVVEDPRRSLTESIYLDDKFSYSIVEVLNNEELNNISTQNLLTGITSNSHLEDQPILTSYGSILNAPTVPNLNSINQVLDIGFATGEVAKQEIIIEPKNLEQLPIPSLRAAQAIIPSFNDHNSLFTLSEEDYSPALSPKFVKATQQSVISNLNNPPSTSNQEYSQPAGSMIDRTPFYSSNIDSNDACLKEESLSELQLSSELTYNDIIKKENLYFIRNDSKIRPQTIIFKDEITVAPADQIQIALKESLKNNSQRLTIKLSPEHLGQVAIELVTSKDRISDLKIVVEHCETLELFRRESEYLYKIVTEVAKNTDVNLSFNLSDQGQHSDFSSQQNKQNSSHNHNNNVQHKLFKSSPVTTTKDIISESKIDIRI